MSKAVVTDEMLSVFTDVITGPPCLNAYEARRAVIQTLLDRGLLSLPVNEEEIREKAIRECIAALPHRVREHDDPANQGWNAYQGTVAQYLQSLLHIDEAEKLAKEWWNGGHRPGTGCYPSSKECAESAFRWLLSRKEREDD